MANAIAVRCPDLGEPSMRASLTVVALTAALAAQEPSRLFRVPGPVAPGTLLRIEQLGLDLLRCCGAAASGDLDVVLWSVAEERRLLAVAPAAKLVRRGEPFRVTYARLQQQYLAQNPHLDLPPDPGYYTVSEVEQEIDALVAAHPAICQKVDLTALPGAVRTHNNHPIYALKISDTVASDEDEPAIVIAAQHHARELNSPHMVIGAMRRVAQGYGADPQLTAVVDQKELWFVPMVNPDGVDHVWNVDNFWRKNRRMTNNWGFLDVTDRGICTVSIPNDPLLVGFQAFFAGVTMNPAYTSGVKKFSPAVSLTIQ